MCHFHADENQPSKYSMKSKLLAWLGFSFEQSLFLNVCSYIIFCPQTTRKQAQGNHRVDLYNMNDILVSGGT